MYQKIMIYIVECFLSNLKSENQLSTINAHIESQSIDDFIATYLYEEKVYSLRDKRPKLCTLIKSLTSKDLLIVESIYLLGHDDRSILSSLSQISEKSSFHILKESITSHSSADQILSVLKALKTSCSRNKAKETIFSRRSISSRKSIGRPPLREEIINEVLELRSKGLSYSQIVNRIGVQNISKASVSRIINRGVTHE